MNVRLSTEIDCDGLPIKVTVEAVVPSGSDELDLALYDAMARACRLLATAARDDQRRIASERAEA